MDDRLESQFPIVRTHTKACAEAMVAMAREDMGLADESEAWDLYQVEVSARFNAMPRVRNYIGSLARILSIEDEPAPTAVQQDRQVQEIGIGYSGEVFAETARTTYYLREKQLIELLDAKQTDPYKLASFKPITETLQYRYTVQVKDFGQEGLRQKALGHINRPGYWARPLVDYLLPLADNTRIRLAEVGLGVGAGLGLVHDAYGHHLSKANKRVQRKINQAAKQMDKAEWRDDLINLDKYTRSNRVEDSE